MTSSNTTRDELRVQGFDLIDETLSYLISCLSDALKSLGEDELIPYIPWSGQVPEGELPKGTQQLYSVGFQLLNMVEERVASAIRREREKELGADSIRGLWPHALKDMTAAGLSPDDIIKVLGDVNVQPVLTAHPTEAKRSSIRERLRALYNQLVRSEYPKYTERERRRIRERMVTALESLWRTGEIHLVRPDIYHELNEAIHYLRDLFPASLNRLDLHFTEAWRDAGFPLEKLREAGNIPSLSFGTWIGGDRDGHPLVTPEVTERSLELLRDAALELLHREITNLASILTLSIHHNEVPEKLQNRIIELGISLHDEEIVSRLQHQVGQEPWRHLASLMAARLKAQIDGAKGYSNPEALGRDLELISESIIANGCALIEEQHIRPLRHKLEIFGFHLAALEIRQNSDFHDRAISQLLTAAGVEDGAKYAEWPEEKRVEFLNAELQSTRPFLHDSLDSGKEATLVLDSYRVIAAHLEENGPAGIGGLIVSMTRQVSDLLGVFLLAREAGLMTPTSEGLICPLEVVPLFETMDDLYRAPEILDLFLGHPIVQRRRSGEQQVMLGYSDSNKDCGILAAAWALHQGQKNLSEVARRHDIKLRYFHGRGGTISRGAGPTHWFMASLPHGSLSGGFRMTEQGEPIAQKYANLANATYHLELLLAGTAITTAVHSRPESRRDPAEDFLPDLSKASQEAYQTLLRSEGFIDFYRQVTPIDALENSCIGSRPTRRTGKKGHSIDDLRAIPWVFSWTQARFYLPGWFGVGTALESLKIQQPERFLQLKEGFRESSFLGYTLTNVETNLASANLEVMTQYSSLVEDESLRERFMEIIVAEFNRTREMLTELYDGDILKRRPRMAKTLEIREAPLKVLHQQQVSLLREWRQKTQSGEEEEAEALLPRMLLSINAIAAGLRTTG
ncbi:MAG: phosphoenolpyruvate carboxylase [Roseibacillus sp.]|nr:phosphoenolpyruvate carboxylase [Roseibacillus sp.]